MTPTDEQDIHDRVRTHGCAGFLAFYSTIPSSGLAAKLNAPSLSYEVQIYDPERVEKRLLSSVAGLHLAQRFFSASISKWKTEHPTPAEIFRDETTLSCQYCRKNLLVPEPHGIVVVWTTVARENETKKEQTEHIYWCCKDHCDKTLERHYWRENLSDGWEDIPDLIIPMVYIRWIMTTLNDLHGGAIYSEEAFESSKELLLNLFPRVCRHLTHEERERIRILTMIPHHFGGLGYEQHGEE